MFQYRNKYLTSFCIILSIIMADQVSKILIHQYPRGLIYPVCSFFNIIHTHNYGVSFSMFQSYTTNSQWVLIILALLICLWIAYMLIQTNLNYEVIGFSIILGGALGNIIDRFCFGYVIDFIQLYINKDFVWPAFNIADSAIVLGSFFILLCHFFCVKNA